MRQWCGHQAVGLPHPALPLRFLEVCTDWHRPTGHHLPPRGDTRKRLVCVTVGETTAPFSDGASQRTASTASVSRCRSPRTGPVRGPLRHGSAAPCSRPIWADPTADRWPQRAAGGKPQNAPRASLGPWQSGGMVAWHYWRWVGRARRRAGATTACSRRPRDPHPRGGPPFGLGRQLALADTAHSKSKRTLSVTEHPRKCR